MTNQKDDRIIKSGAYRILSTVGVQAIIVVLSFVTGIILPERMGPQMYGYWQIYVLYSAYLNLFGLGYSDGMALYYGGQKYRDLPFGEIRSAIQLGAVFLCTITTVVYCVLGAIPSDEHRFIFRALAINIPLTCIACIVISTASATNQIALYNGLNLWQRIATIGAYVLLLAVSLSDFKSIIIGDTIAKAVFAGTCIYVGRSMFFGKRTCLSVGIAEFRQKASAGLNITLAAIAANVMPIAGKFAVQFAAPVIEFGQYSFGMSLINIVVTFTSAAGLVIFPLLKRLKGNELSEYFQTFSLVCGCLLFAAMFAYLPCRWLIQYFMPEYLAVLEYLHVLLIICVPLGRTQLLLLPYFKALRLERSYFIGNIIGVIVMLGVTWCAYFMTQKVFAVALSASLVYTLWGLVLETYLTKKLAGQMHYWRGQILNIIMMVAFVLCASSDSLIKFVVGYGISYCLYLLMQNNELKAALKMVRS